jgi:hypothetical protein
MTGDILEGDFLGVLSGEFKSKTRHAFFACI